MIDLTTRKIKKSEMLFSHFSWFLCSNRQFDQTWLTFWAAQKNFDFFTCPALPLRFRNILQPKFMIVLKTFKKNFSLSEEKSGIKKKQFFSPAFWFVAFFAFFSVQLRMNRTEQRARGMNIDKWNICGMFPCTVAEGWVSKGWINFFCHCRWKRRTIF